MEVMNEQSETACFDVDGVRYRYLYMKEDDPARAVLVPHKPHHLP